jgi:enoyl-CoA hydratase
MVETSSDDGRIKVEQRDNILLMGIDRPAKLNGFSPKMIAELGEAYVMLENDKTVFCGLL